MVHIKIKDILNSLKDVEFIGDVSNVQKNCIILFTR
ncbi:UDP-N-acetylmuramoylalanyl-D-glutamyl-L-ornithine--D-alanyl-D-alanine ligase [Borrelia duttonii CR2A]|uniref:UDP-N-acetylmuramoylalanyl-D-glutamyl-L-ornithine--D-alanyl-D-alanine ligase n=1 Tax=Borrelia duttonii CR2A TaxID=1432657 RepID=W6TLY3_9SPIR|nr:UDP-N-acetylmuramoylalanyl-D-glutamyl-L-ornithine--D-alanyl-D-alanine ligase [Borrelia duttonii CR2A]